MWVAAEGRAWRIGASDARLTTYHYCDELMWCALEVMPSGIVSHHGPNRPS